MGTYIVQYDTIGINRPVLMNRVLCILTTYYHFDLLIEHAYVYSRITPHWNPENSFDEKIGVSINYIFTVLFTDKTLVHV